MDHTGGTSTVTTSIHDLRLVRIESWIHNHSGFVFITHLRFIPFSYHNIHHIVHIFHMIHIFHMTHTFHMIHIFYIIHTFRFSYCQFSFNHQQSTTRRGGGGKPMGQIQVERKTFQSEENVTEIIKTILEGYDIRLRPDFGGKNIETTSSSVLVQF